MMMGLLSDDNYSNFSFDYRSHGGTADMLTDGGLSYRDPDQLCVHQSKPAGRALVQYFYHITYDGKGTITDKLRRSYKSIVQSRRCPGCNWIPKWKSSFGPYPLTDSDIVWCSKKCRERSLK